MKTKTHVYKLAVNRLKHAYTVRSQSKEYSEIFESKDEVLGRFGPVFSLDNINDLTEDDMKSFLLYENNKHWTGLHRSGNRICSDMQSLRKYLNILLDESQPLEDRANKAVDKIYGMGKGILTAILLVAYPGKYGVWNRTSEDTLIELGIWPEFERGSKFGEKYKIVNELLLQLADDLNVDLWELDGLFWFLPRVDDESTVTQVDDDEATFALEKYLHEFIRDNWSHLELSKTWDIYEEHGEPELGFKYRCDVGEIDLLAYDKKNKCWLVIELKRNQTPDDTIGQVQRYMGWVREELAKRDEKVKGLIIARTADKSFQYALKVTTDISFMRYSIDFQLKNEYVSPS